MRLLVVSTLFPNPAEPLHALFVERRVAALARIANVRVVSPVPWFPGAVALGRYAHRRAIPDRAQRGELEVRYPRFLSVPGVLKSLDAPALLRTLARTAAALERDEGFRPEAVDANLGYPDGVAALSLAGELRVPCGVTLRGVDVNELPEIDPRGRGRALARMLARADAVFPVSDALRARALELGAPPERTVTIRNGVDTGIFHPRPKGEARRLAGLPEGGRVILSAGHLAPRKRFDVLVDALLLLRARGRRDVTLAIAGGRGAEGCVRRELEAKIAELGLGGVVRLLGPRSPEALAHLYNAADVFALASLVEGRPNVAIEAVASGTPVVAVRCWGLPEIVPDERYGFLLERGAAADFAEALDRALERRWDAVEIAALFAATSWDETARVLISKYEELLGERRRAA